MKSSLPRRQFLRNAGALVALPFLESLGRVSAFAATPAVRPPMRLGIFTVTGGTVLESWKCAQDGPLGALPSILRPLDFCKDDLLLLNGLAQDGASENVNGHEHCAFTHLTGAERVKREGGRPHASISLDQAVANAIGQDTLLPSLELGLASHETVYSFRDDGTSVPYEADPQLVFDRMFRGRQPIVPNWSRRASSNTKPEAASRDTYEQSVIDLVRENTRALNRKLGRADQQKLGEYLESVRSVEVRMQTLQARLKEEALDAAQPGPGKLVDPGIADFSFGQMRNAIGRDPEKHAQYISLMADMMILALQTDSTRVVTFAAGSDEASFPGVVTVGYERHCHTLEHQGNAGNVADADPISREACRQIHAWYTTLFAEMVRKMKAIDEGGSTLLDNTMLLYTSYMADGGHGRRDYPVLLVGNAQGTLKTGRQLSFQKQTPVANLYVEMLDRMGAQVDEFGNSNTAKGAAYGGRLPGLV
ncbi:MAG: hypothetical protein ACI8XO_003254 [Verrucomicrobiales bacterium]|jgi:hypothetical protein